MRIGKIETKWVRLSLNYVDVRDSLRINSRKFIEGKLQRRIRTKSRRSEEKDDRKNVNIAENIDQDVLDFGVYESSTPAKPVSSDRDNDSCHPPSNKSLNATNLFNRRCH